MTQQQPEPDPNPVFEIIPTNITMIPNEILKLLFNHLPNKDVLTCRKVCNLWRAIVDLSISVPLEVTPHNFMELFCQTNISNRFMINRVHSLTIRGQAAAAKKIPLSCPFNPIHLKNVTFVTTQINPINFRLLLQTCTGIESLTIEYGRTRDTGTTNWQIEQIIHPGLRTLNIFNLFLKHTKQAIQLLENLSAPRLARFSVLGRTEKIHREHDVSILSAAILAFIHRHRESLEEINPYMRDDDYNRNLTLSRYSPEISTEKVYSVRILDICAYQWRNVIEELVRISKIELSLSTAHGWSSVETILTISRFTLTEISISCDNLRNVDLRFFQNFYILKILSLTCYKKCVLKFVSALPSQIEEIHFCTFPLTKENWDELLDPRFQKLNGLEIGVYTDQSTVTTLDAGHYEKLKNHKTLSEAYIHGPPYVLKWEEIEEQGHGSIMEVNKSNQTIHLKFNQSEDD